MSTNNLILLKSWRFMRTHCYYKRLCLSLFTNYKIHTDQINASSVPSITFNLSLSTLDLFPSISQHPWSLSIYLSVPSTSFNLSLRIYLSVPSISFNQSIRWLPSSIQRLTILQIIPRDCINVASAPSISLKPSLGLTSIFHPNIDNTAGAWVKRWDAMLFKNHFELITWFTLVEVTPNRP